MKAVPPICKFMTPAPHTIAQDATIADAFSQMAKLRIRHLPVLVDGRLVGVLSERDVHLVRSLTDLDSSKIRVADAMTTTPFTVSPSESCDRVAGEMANQRYGCAIVMDGDAVVGVVTTVDICRAFADGFQN